MQSKETKDNVLMGPIYTTLLLEPVFFPLNTDVDWNTDENSSFWLVMFRVKPEKVETQPVCFGFGLLITWPLHGSIRIFDLLTGDSTLQNSQIVFLCQFFKIYFVSIHSSYSDDNVRTW